MAKTRTAKSLINSSVSMGFYLLTLCISLFSRRIFIGVLGKEISGIRDTLGHFLATLGLAELGVGAAIGYALYKPLHDKDYNLINEIVSLQGWIYRRVATFVTIGAIILVLLFPWIIKDMETGRWVVYATFVVFFWETMMSYLVNYRAIIFGADQRGYRLSLNMQGFSIGKVVLQLLVLYFAEDLGIKHPYIYYLVLEVAMSLIRIYVLERMIKKDYPWLKTDMKDGWALLKKHSEIVTKIKQIFFHKIGSVAFYNISPLVMYAFTSFSILTFYQSYIVLSKHISSILSQMFNSIGAGIGNLVAEGNKKKILKFFWEYASIQNYTATIAAFCFYSFASHLIPLWIGHDPDFILPQSIVILITISIYVNMTRFLNIYLDAYGLFQDVWAPVLEGILNVGGGLLLGYYFYNNYEAWGLVSADYGGLLGVLIGAQISLVIILFGWQPVFLFHWGFKISVWNFWRNYIKYPLVSFIYIIAAIYTLDWLDLDFSTIPSFLLNAIWPTIVFTLLLFIIYWSMSQGIRDLTDRFIILFREKLFPNIKKKFKG